MEEEPVQCGCGGYTMAILDWCPNIENGATGTMFKVHCLNCGISVFADKKDEAINKWNRAMTGNKDFATIEGYGDLHYCGYCKADLPTAWLENYEYCPECKKVFKNKYYE